MTTSRQKKILSSVPPEDFVGRSGEIERLLRHAKGTAKGGLLLLAAPGIGATELLKQTFDSLFIDRDEVIPFYFAIDRRDRTAVGTAQRFLHQFLLQKIAFRRRDSQILESAPELSEISRLSVPADARWIERLIEAYSATGEPENKRSYIRQCFNAPLRAAAGGARVFVMLDDLHEAEWLEDGDDLLAELKDLFSRESVPFVFAGHRRFLFGTVESQAMPLDEFSFQDAGRYAEAAARRYEVSVNDQTRDLIVTQMSRNPVLINFLFQAAVDNEASLDSFRNVEQIYAGEIFGGRIARHFGRILKEIAPTIEAEKNLLGLLYDAAAFDKEPLPVEIWQQRTGLVMADSRRAVRELNTREIIRLTSGRVEPMEENSAFTDYLTARFRLEIASENRASVFADSLSGFLKRAPVLMSQHYRQSAAIGLRELMAEFNEREIPLALIDYGKFKDEYKGAPDSEIIGDLRSTKEFVRLPQIVFTAHTSTLYEPIGLVTEKERSAVAFGFRHRKYTDSDEIVWIAAEISSKLEASKELAEFWCDRLEMVALMCDFRNYQLWLVAPEGFSPPALGVLRQRHALGSSRKQFALLTSLLRSGPATSTSGNVHEFEIVVPMDEDSEMIAAHAVEEIAKRHNFDAKAINQIKTALVEACINASEHSLSPDRKIHQKFTVDDERITITISNRGLRLADKNGEESDASEGRRGWGLNLMRRLMDDVTIEEVDDGTRISMTKFLKT